MNTKSQNELAIFDFFVPIKTAWLVLLVINTVGFIALTSRFISKGLMICIIISLLSFVFISRHEFEPYKAHGWRFWIVSFVAMLLVIFITSTEYKHSQIILALLILTIYLTLHTYFYSISSSRVFRYIFFCVIVGAVFIYIIRALGLAVSPDYHVVDEPWYFGYVVGFHQEGFLKDSLILGYNAPIWPLLSRYWLIPGLWVKILGLGVWQMRFFHLILVVFIVTLTTISSYNLFGKIPSYFTFLFLGSSHIGVALFQIRNDVGLGLAIAASLFFYSIAIKKDKLLFHLIAGFVLGMGTFAHYNGAPFGPAFLIGLYLPQWIQKRQLFPPKDMIAFTIGGSVAALIVILVLLSSLHELVYFWSPRRAQETSGFLVSFSVNLFNIATYSIIEFLLVIVALFAAIRYTGIVRRSIGLTILLCHLVLGYIAASAFPVYIRALLPLYALAIGTLFGIGIQNNNISKQVDDLRYIVSIGMIFVVLATLTLQEPVRHVLAEGRLQPEAPPTVEWIQENIPCKETVIVGPHIYYFWLYDYNYGSYVIDEHLLRTKSYQNSTPETIWNMVQPDFVLENLNGLTRSKFFSDTDYLASNDYMLVAEILEETGETILFIKVKLP